MGLGMKPLQDLGPSCHLRAFTLFQLHHWPLHCSQCVSGKHVPQDFCFCCPSSRNCLQTDSLMVYALTSFKTWLEYHLCELPLTTALLLSILLSHAVCCTNLLIYYNLPIYGLFRPFECKLCENMDFCLFSSLLYFQHLTAQIFEFEPGNIQSPSIIISTRA